LAGAGLERAGIGRSALQRSVPATP
jgi:hypothetical protein